MPVNNYFRFSVGLMRSIGLLPSSKLSRKIFALTVLFPMTLILNFLIFYNLGLPKENILEMAEAFESLSTFSQLTVRKFIFLFHGRLIEEIITDCQYEWKRFDSFGPEIETELHKRMQFGVKLIKTFFIFPFITICLMGVSALIDDSKLVPLNVWIPDVEYATEVIFICEMLILMETLHIVITTDSFYLTVGAYLQVQFRLIAETVKSIKFGQEEDNECSKKLTQCVQHHRWSIKLHKKLNGVFSEYFVVQYAVTVCTVAIQMYLILYSNQSLAIKLRASLYFFSVMFQVALYFIPASNIEIESENFSMDLYLATWEANTKMSISKHLLFMIMESQKSLQTFGAGILRISRPVYLGIIRLGFTISTILGGLR